MSEAINNKESASLDDVGRLHRMVTNAFTQKLGAQLKKAKKKNGDADLDINTLDLSAAARWIAYNDVKCASQSEERVSEIKDELEEIRKKNRGKKLKAVGD